MEFLTFLAERLEVSPGEASQHLERALSNYRPSKHYAIHVLDAGDGTSERRFDRDVRAET